MAREVEQLVLRMSADIRMMEKALGRAEARFNSSARQIEQRQKELDKNLANAGANAFGKLRAGVSDLMPVLTAAFSTTAVIRYADAYTNLQNRLKAAGLEGDNLRQTEDALYEAANRNGVAVDAVAQLYQRASLARNQLGASDEQLIALTNGVTAALRVQGVSAAQASGPLLQLGQALGGGTVRAEELNSMLEGTPILLQAAAAGSQRFNGDMQALTAAIRNGEVTSKEFFAALLAGLPELERRAADLPKTVGQALQTLDNEMGKFIGRSDASLSASARLAQAIDGLAQNLDVVVGLAGVLALVMGTKVVLALTAATSATLLATAESLRYQLALVAMEARQTGVTRATLLSTAAMRGFSAAIAANPIGAAVVAVAALTAGIVMLDRSLSKAVPPSEDLRDATSQLDRATREYTDAVRLAAVATGEEAKTARAAAIHKREQAAQSLATARAKLIEAQATIALNAAEGRRRIDADRFNFRGDRAGTHQIYTGPELAALRQAQADAAEARASIDRNLADIAKANADLQASPPIGGPASPVPPASGAAGAGAGQAQRLQPFDVFDPEIQSILDELAYWRDVEKRGMDAADPLRTGRDFVSTDEAFGAIAEQAAEAQRETQFAVYWGVRGGLEAGFREGLPGMLTYFRDALARSAMDALAVSLTERLTKGGGGGFLATLLGSGIPGFAAGTRHAPGGLAIVGERGPELVNLPAGAGVLPNHLLRNAAMAPTRPAGPRDLNFKLAINLEGANGDETIRRIAYQAAFEGATAARTMAVQDVNRQQGRRAKGTLW